MQRFPLFVWARFVLEITCQKQIMLQSQRETSVLDSQFKQPLQSPRLALNALLAALHFRRRRRRSHLQRSGIRNVFFAKRLNTVLNLKVKCWVFLITGSPITCRHKREVEHRPLCLCGSLSSQTTHAPPSECRGCCIVSVWRFSLESRNNKYSRTRPLMKQTHQRLGISCRRHTHQTALQ